MRIVLIAVFSLVSFLSLAQKTLPKVQIEEIKQMSDDQLLTDTPFIEAIYSYLCMNFDSTGNKLNVVQYSEEIGGICSFNQRFKGVYYELNTCNIFDREVLVRFDDYSIRSVQSFTEQIVKTYDIDDVVPFIWNKDRTKYFTGLKEMELYFEIIPDGKSITVRHYFTVE